MATITDWLASLGLSEYAGRFAENGIDISVLPDLTDQDLKDIGVLLGHRRKMLRAIGELAGTGATTPLHEAAPEPNQGYDAERRQVTVVFADLVGSTALSTRMDPEDLREVISAYQKCVTETVRRFDGFVAKYMGDGVLVYFGYPKAHEDDAERAVRTGLELIAAVTELKTRASLQTRVGIATGLVVVGDLIGSGEAQERGIVGETPNLAARLQALAEPNSVLIAEGTRKLLGNLFELQDLGAKDLKGLAGPTRVWAALRGRSVESHFEALHGTGVTALVGREEESELLLRRWSRAKTGEGQVVLLSGEAGIGKSRLTAALLEQLAGEQHTRLRHFCSPQRTDSALYPVIGQMERAARLAHDDTPQSKLDKLDAVLAQTSTSIDDAAILAEMLSLPNDGRYPALQMDPQQRRQKTLQALLSQTEALTRQSPVLMILEDAHWSDPTSLELFGLVIARIEALPALLIVTFRPEFQPPWIGRPYVSALTINRLVQRDVNAIIDRVAGNRLLPPSLRQDIIERTDGIPLFVEEMTKSVLEAESEEAAKQMVAAVASASLAVPASLYASLMARLDRLGAAKEVAQIGAVIGREFAHSLLAAVVHRPQAELGSALDRLVEAGLLFRQGVPPHATYLFKHALVQDAAYGTLLREPRCALHARIAKALETHFAKIAETQPELLARHYTEAGLVEKAASLWGKAGQRSLERSAVVEAKEQLSRALGQLATLPSTPTLRREQIKLQIAFANALMHAKGYAASETKASLDQARSLIERAEALDDPLDDPLLKFSVLYGLWVASYNSFNGDAVREIAAQTLTLAEKEGTTIPLMIGHRLWGISLAHTGDVAEGRAHLDVAAGLYDPVEHRPLATRFGQEIGVAILFQRSLPLWILGYPEAALMDSDRAISNARAIGQATTLMPALLYTSISHILCRDYGTAKAQSDELVKLADEKGSALWKAFGILLQGCVFALSGRASDAVPIITAGIGALRSTGSTLWTPLWFSHLAKSHADLGQFTDAWRCIGEAIGAIETTREKMYEADVHRMAGEIALMLPQPDVAKAEAYFECAIAVGRAQQAKSWELRAAMSMARLKQKQGKTDDARNYLAPVFNWFTEGFETLDLKEAKTLLVDLAQ